MKQSKWLVGFVVFVIVIIIAPLIILVAAAFSETNILTFPPQGFSLKWFEYVFSSNQFMDGLITSLKVSLLATLIALVLGVPVAYALVRFNFRGQDVVETIFSLPFLVPWLVVGFAMLRFFVLFGNLDVLTGLIVGHAAVVFPYAVRVVSASLRNLDAAIEEAAISLGANRLRTFFLIVLPNIQTGILAAFIMAFISAFNNVPVALFLTGPGVSTLPISMLNYMHHHWDPSIAAVSTLTVILSLGIVLGAERSLGLSKFI